MVTLTGPCQHVGARISFLIKDIQNAPSQVKSTNFEAYWTSSSYQTVAEFTGTSFVQNEIFGSLPTDQYKLEQVDENFGVENLYTVRFTPVNPIPQAGIVLI